MQLEVDLVVEHVLAQGTAEHGLHRVLCHGVHPQPVHISVAILAVGTLVHLWGHIRHSDSITCSTLKFIPHQHLTPSPEPPEAHSLWPHLLRFDFL